MKRFGLAIIASAALLGAAFSGPAQAMPASGSDLAAAANNLNVVEKTQFFFGGRRFCWYWGGWHGPGWYWCGYAWRRGFGWGGPRGWHGWVYRGRGPVIHNRTVIHNRRTVIRRGPSHPHVVRHAHPHVVRHGAHTRVRPSGHARVGAGSHARGGGGHARGGGGGHGHRR